MSRAAITPTQLAREADCEPDEVLVRLWDVGISIHDAGQHIPRGQLALARRTRLGYPLGGFLPFVAT